MIKICNECKKQIIKKPNESQEYWNTKKYCSNTCRFKNIKGTPKKGIYKKCLGCGKMFYLKQCHKDYLKNCSKKCHGIWMSKNRIGPNAAHWISGLSIGKGGYIRMYSPKHPRCDSQGYVFLHRLIMEEKIKRYLKKEEVVHHIDENPSNNHPDNLMLFKNNGEHRKFHGKK